MEVLGSPKISIEPTVEPISLVEAKSQIRVDISDDDTLISSYIKASRIDCEDFLNRQMITATWELYLDFFPSIIYLPRPPLQSVSSIKYYDSDDILQTISSSDYIVDTKSFQGRIVEASSYSWPSTYDKPNAVIVTFVCGYGDEGSDVPETFRQAIRLLVGHYYENREETQIIQMRELPAGVSRLLWKKRNKVF